ncbi:hypothetical protein CSX12_11445 [Microbacterium sp. Y-01]|nr:hypothetical protein CSX12_11445 [Microbacterium sp. Y-01]
MGEADGAATVGVIVLESDAVGVSAPAAMAVFIAASQTTRFRVPIEDALLLCELPRWWSVPAAAILIF